MLWPYRLRNVSRMRMAASPEPVGLSSSGPRSAISCGQLWNRSFVSHFAVPHAHVHILRVSKSNTLQCRRAVFSDVLRGVHCWSRSCTEPVWFSLARAILGLKEGQSRPLDIYCRWFNRPRANIPLQNSVVVQKNPPIINAIFLKTAAMPWSWTGSKSNVLKPCTYGQHEDFDVASKAWGFCMVVTFHLNVKPYIFCTAAAMAMPITYR